ncbi:MAG TPA: ABC transporter substrate-binding protein, partial [Vicinamibacteria bacterium]|nr:ABC transporter substrate-binding protein [Vicinamibacteria bacterium]
VTSTDQGTFTGTLHIERFAVHDGRVVAVGHVMGTLVDETGAIIPIYRTLNFPVIMPTPPLQSGVQRGGGDCEILHLELGPLDLDLLGLVVHLDRVVLDIRAEPGAGNLLGNLLCAIVNLLNNGGPLSQLAQLLNRLLDLL